MRGKKLAIAGLVAAGILGSTTNAGASTDHVPCAPGGTSAQDTTLSSALAGELDWELSAEQASCARAVYRHVLRSGYDQRAAVIAVAAAITEARLLNLTYGDATSLGLFQMLDTHGTRAQREDVAFETTWFLHEMDRQYPHDSWQTAPIGEVDADVEQPAKRYRGRYRDNVTDAVAIVQGVAAQQEMSQAIRLTVYVTSD